MHTQKSVNAQNAKGFVTVEEQQKVLPVSRIPCVIHKTLMHVPIILPIDHLTIAHL